MAAERQKAGMPTDRAVQREIRDYARVHERRRRQLPRSLLVGLISGLAAVAFRGALAGADAARGAIVAFVHAHLPWTLPVPLLLGAAGATVAIYLVRRFAPEAAGSGIPQVKATLYHLSTMEWRRVLPVKFAGGLLGIGSGLALGREGPTIQMGAAVGQMVSGWFSCTTRERRTLLAAGAGAGLAAAFNAPLAGLVFVLEEIQRDFSPAVFTATLIASGVADVTTRLLLGQMPVFAVQVGTIPPLGVLPFAFFLGLVTALLGVAFNRCLLAGLRLYDGVASSPAWVAGGLAGCAVGVVAIIAPDAVGSGHHLVERLLAGELPLATIAALLVVRFGLTISSYGCGAPGGIFAPLLVLGAGIGIVVGHLGQAVAPQWVGDAQLLPVVGMAAYFSAIVRAPLTAIVLMVEMTGNYSLVLPLLLACLTAYGIADLLGDRPVYEALLQRDLLRAGTKPALEGTLLVDFTIAPGAPFDGRTVRELGLPARAIIVTLRRGFREELPTADSLLNAGDQITVLIAPEAAGALALLRRGSGAAER
jgi:CIC family chloride channel protein